MPHAIGTGSVLDRSGFCIQFVLGGVRQNDSGLSVGREVVQRD
eukprot:CAMPEP_0201643156 /NCGR_PEP_ID=MMETSP0493-20130528/27637_1 /ASSEMBLY_ACC=CAM_ASM_000838 /TAXON_ID=420259 /ORGANISM="Thalassiosira gravida, Strain GMp14c1" /LENGTH=42 /DNA_ID= /DNA_START= /DNA_END= /DNA_ORIENTATION=